MTDDPCAICGDNPSIYCTKHAVEHAAISEYVSAQGQSRRFTAEELEALRIAISLFNRNGWNETVACHAGRSRKQREAVTDDPLGICCGHAASVHTDGKACTIDRKSVV